MGKVIKKKIQGMSWRMKTTIVLLLTLVSSVFMYQGWYKPKPAQAAVTQQIAWTNGYNAAGFPTSFNVTVTNGTNRMLVVAVASTINAAATQTCTVTYGGTALTAVNGDGATSAQQHTWLFYLPENATLMNNTARPLVATVTGGTAIWNSVAWAVYNSVDQGPSPIRSTDNYNSGATSDTPLALPAGVNIVTGDMAVEVINLSRTGTTAVRTISTWGAGWASALLNGSGTSANPAVNRYVARSTTAGTTTAAHTASGTCLRSATAMVIKQLMDLTIGDGTNPSSGNAPQGSTGNALDAFTLKMRTGTATVSALTFTGGAQFTSANVSAIKIYRDNGTIGTLDGADVLVPTSTAWASNVATITFTTAESVSTTTGNYLVVVDVAAAATVGNALSGTITAATGTGLGVIDYQDTSSAGLTIKTSALTVGNGFNPANASAPRGSLNNAMNAFTLDKGVGSGTVNTLTLTGSAQFIAANVASIKIYRDKGNLGALDGSDILVPTTYTHAGTNATITITTPEPVTTTPVKYLVVINAAAAATVGNTLSGTITAATGTGLGTPVYSDSASGTLTITATGVLTIGNGTNPVNANAPLTSNDNSLDAFTTTLSAGKGQINTLTLTGSANFTAANIANIKVFVDKGTIGTLDGADMLIPTTYTHAGSVATITITNPEVISATAKNYLVAVDIKPGATVAQTFTGTITAVTGSGYTGAPTYSDAGSATLTIAKALFANNSCASCHGYSSLYYDGSARNTPAGTFVGSHATHTGEYAFTCSVCHVTPATTTSADYNHQNGTIQMASPINGDAGAAYGKGASWAATNSPTAMQTCSNTYCHSQGVSKTTQAGDTTRAISAPQTTLNWGDTASCDSCHGNPPNYPNGATTWGGTAKANSHSAHTTHCETCHNGTTTTGDTITNVALHTNKAYNIAAGNGETIGSYTYNEAGGSCADISCHGGVGINNAQWGTSLDCTTCHDKVVNSPRAAALNAAVTTRDNVVAEFGLAWGHKKTGRAAVAAADCIVCHLEGDYTTQKTSSYHGDGNIDLRDPDGAGDTPIQNMSGATFTFTKFATSYAAGSRTPNGETANTIDNIITQKFCVACHDSNGATNPTARSNNGGTGTAAMPFGGIALGATYTAANNAIGTQGLIDVKTQFAITNSSRHPVLGSLTRDFPYSTRLAAPYNNIGTARDSNGTSGHTTALSVVINCFDCHNVPGASPLTSRTVSAHGNAVTLRGTIYAFGAVSTLCSTCHTGYTVSGNHSTGSAWSQTGSSHNVSRDCQDCHGSYQTTGTAPARPQRAQDYHGSNALNGGGLWPTVNSRPYAFIRAWGDTAYHRPYRSSEFTTGSATCGFGGGVNTCPAGGSGGDVGDGGDRTYTAGGTY